LILLDVKLPDGNGIELCREIRTSTKLVAIPVLFLTAVEDGESEMEGLSAGGNDYLRKPYNIDFLCRKVANMLSLQASHAHRIISEQESFAIGPLRFELVSNQVFCNDKDLLLTQKEFAVLFFLAKNERKTLSSEHIYEKVWGWPLKESVATFKVRMSNLKKKLSSETDSVLIETTRGEGYCLTIIP
jgi:DNA-binding response OmpR family regulator